MDTILRGIVDSNHPSNLKRILVQKVVLPAASNENHDTSVCSGVFQQAVRLATQLESEYDQHTGMLIFECWSKHDSIHFHKFLCNGTIARLLFDSLPCCNKSAILQLFRICISSYLGDTDELETFCATVLSKYALLVDCSGDLSSARHLALLIEDFPFLLNKIEDSLHLGNCLLNSLSRCQLPWKTELLSQLFSDVQIVCELLGKLWSVWNSHTFETVFMKLYEILAVSPEEMEPSICLASVASRIPVKFLSEKTSAVFMRMNVTDDVLELVLKRLMNWLQWPVAKNVDHWVLWLMQSLTSVKKFSILISVSHASIDQIFRLVHIPATQSAAFPVLAYILLSYQHSAAVFHKILPDVPALVNGMKNQPNADVNLIMQISDLVFALMQLHTGFPELYDPVMKALEGFNQPDPKVGKEILRLHAWEVNSVNVITSLTFLPVSTTGRIGLTNLGNTCYMNSVLQALYMSDEFRDHILCTTADQYQLLRVKLQFVFGFLTLTKRVSYSPQTFFNASKPPWFENMHQQDCTEFLRYLFDVLHEQETLSIKHSNKVDKCKEDSACDNSTCQCLAHQMFGGRLAVSYRCLSCQNVSSQSETFIDIPLTFPPRPPLNIQSESQDMAVPNSLQSSSLKLDDLLVHFFSPELLEGGNSYHCTRCMSLQSAEKHVHLESAPPYLILSLLRFSFDTVTREKTKILTNVDYPLCLELPIDSSISDVDSSQLNIRGNNHVKYALYAVVVHSGISSDCGHYYTYASRANADQGLESSLPENSRCPSAMLTEKSATEQQWFLFNDSNVSFANLESLQTLSSRFPVDTAYLLFYKKISERNGSVSASDEQKLNFPSYLKEAVEQDNRLYLWEKEKEASKQKAVQDSKNNGFWRDFDDQNPPSNCGEGGFGSFGSQFSRFVF